MLFTMRICLTVLIFALPFAAAAQDLPAPEPLQVPPIEIERPQIEITPTPDETEQQTEAETIEGEEVIPDSLAPDYSKLSPKAERAARLNDLFVKLAERDDEESANLVAEEIVAIWTESGSASVNLLLRRGSEATAKGDAKLARKMYNYAVDLSPEYAEAWARSARLALTQKQYNRALNESLKTLQLEPRHFYTLWTLGNVFEVLNRQDEALEAYREANRLYPELKAVKERLEQLEIEIGGTVL
ncbi:MAG: hypothetical protein ABJO36_11075 [Litorimonas sp.]